MHICRNIAHATESLQYSAHERELSDCSSLKVAQNTHVGPNFDLARYRAYCAHDIMALNNKLANKMSTETCAVDDANVAGASPLHTPGSAHTARALPVL